MIKMACRIFTIGILSLTLMVLSSFLPGGKYCPMRLELGQEHFPAPPAIYPFGQSYALPNFARKYNFECAMCHKEGVFPRLNDIGYKFRRAGYRLPEEIGKPQTKKFAFGDYFSAAAQDSFHVTSEGDSTTGDRNNNAAFEPGEFGFFPLTGSLGKYWGTRGELTVTTDGEIEVENSQVRFVYGNDHNFLMVRGGVFHPLEGYFGSDDPLGLNFPLFMMTSANRNQDDLFTIEDFNFLGLTAGYTYKNSNISVTLTNSIRPDISDDELDGSRLVFEGNSPADVQVNFTQLLGTKGSGITFYYNTGNTRLPQDPQGFIDGTNDALFSDRFQRWALFGSYFPLERLGLLTGASIGRDKYFDPGIGAVAGSFTSWGVFGEVDYYPLTGLGLGGRYDYFDPAVDFQNNIQAASFFVNYVPVRFLQVILDYQYQRQQMEPSGFSDSHNLITQLMFIY